MKYGTGPEDRTTGIRDDRSHMTAFGHLCSITALIWLQDNPQIRLSKGTKCLLTLIGNNWVRAAVVTKSDAARCQGDPFQLCLKTQNPRAKERGRRREKSSWSYFFPPNKIGRLFFTLIHASSLRSPWCCGNCGTEARPTNSTRQLVPVIGTGIFVSVGGLHLYQAAHRRKLQAAVYFKCNGTWQAQKCSAKMPVQCVHCDWNTVLSHQRVEFVSHSKRGWSQNKIPTVTRKTNAGWAVAALQ